MEIPVDALKLVRNRLSLIHQLLRKLSEQVAFPVGHKSKMPSYQRLLAQFQTLITQLQTIVAQLDANSGVLRATNAYPLPSLPTTQHEGLVTTLLRKKPLPEVDAWIEEAIAESKLFKLPIHTDDEFGEWCYAKVKELEANFDFEGFNSASAGQASEAPPMPLNNALRFMVRGELP